MKKIFSIILFTLLTFLLVNNLAFSQNKTTRILFVVDGSGSMKEQIDGKRKFDIAKELLAHVVDSLSTIAGRVEIGVRVFGHQSPRSEQNCKDSKLELNFGKHYGSEILSMMDGFTPQGFTPIAYSLQLAALDFPNDPNTRNAIILITDGVESCEGNPCEIIELFQEKRIALKPYVIGLGVNEEDAYRYDCLKENYFDAPNTTQCSNALNVIISQALYGTTVQVNLLDSSQKPTETNVTLSFSDSYTGHILYNLVHSIKNGVPDTFYMDPIGKYDIVAHTIPPVTKKEIEITPGTHNHIAIDVPQGYLKIISDNISSPGVIIRQDGKDEILFVQDFNTEVKYLIGSYDLEILTLPRKYIDDIIISQSQIKEINIPLNGTLIVMPSEVVNITLMEEVNVLPNKIWEQNRVNSKTSIELQPGTYIVIYRKVKNANTIDSKHKLINIESGKSVILNLD